MQDTDELTTEAIRERMDAHIAAASESAEIDPANIGLIDDLAAKFLDSLTPKEMGFYDTIVPNLPICQRLLTRPYKNPGICSAVGASSASTIASTKLSQARGWGRTIAQLLRPRAMKGNIILEDGRVLLFSRNQRP